MRVSLVVVNVEMGKSKFLEVWEAEDFTSRLDAEPYTDEDAKIVAKYGI